MKKVIAGIALLAALPFLAKAAPDIGFYLFMAVVVALIILLLGRKKRNPRTDEGWKLRRVGKAVKAVRSKRMTMAEACTVFNVTEKEIRALHYLDTE